MSYDRLNAYHIMWLIIMFDLPVKLKKDQKAAALFRKNLEKDGFVMHQFSVYLRYCGSLESVAVHIRRIRSFSPPNGHVPNRAPRIPAPHPMTINPAIIRGSMPLCIPSST